MRVVGTREGYDLWSEVYDSEKNPLILLETPLIDDLMGGIRGKTILELGCGTARHSLKFAAQEAHVTAVDQSQGMLERAKQKQKAEKIHFIHHDITKQLPFDNASFDIVCSFLVLDHIEDLKGFMREAKRVCRKDGFILISSMHPAMNLIGVQARFRPLGSQTKIAPESFFHQVSDYINAALRAGLKLEHFSEHCCPEEILEYCKKTRSYQIQPMLLLLKLLP